jgi:hypothetical protein
VRDRDAECDREPDVPITDTVETAGVEPDAEDEPPPPHPVSAIRDKMQASRIGSPILRRRMQMHPIAAASAVSGTKGELAGRVFTLALADAVIVRIDPPVPVTLDGANAHVTPAGSPEHDSETDCTNPFNPLMFTCVAAFIPTGTVIACEVRERVKSGAGRLIM